MQTKAGFNGIYVGLKQSKKAIESGNAAKAYIAEDCDFQLRRRLEELCDRHGVETLFIPTMKQLGARFGINVGAAVAVTLKANK